jgi:hypothetical protein
VARCTRAAVIAARPGPAKTNGTACRTNLIAAPEAQALRELQGQGTDAAYALDVNVTEVETVLRRTASVALGEYRCGIDHARFAGTRELIESKGTRERQEPRLNHEEHEEHEEVQQEESVRGQNACAEFVGSTGASSKAR